MPIYAPEAIQYVASYPRPMAVANPPLRYYDPSYAAPGGAFGIPVEAIRRNPIYAPEAIQYGSTYPRPMALAYGNALMPHYPPGSKVEVPRSDGSVTLATVLDVRGEADDDPDYVLVSEGPFGIERHRLRQSVLDRYNLIYETPTRVLNPHRHRVGLPEGRGPRSIPQTRLLDSDPRLGVAPLQLLDTPFSNPMEKLQTTYDKGHDHVAYVAENGFGFTSVDNDHKHMIRDGVIQSAKGHTHELCGVAKRNPGSEFEDEFGHARGWSMQHARRHAEEARQAIADGDFEAAEDALAKAMDDLRQARAYPERRNPRRDLKPGFYAPTAHQLKVQALPDPQPVKFANPSAYSKKAREFLSKKIPTLIREGYPQDQAVAIAMSQARKKRLKVPPEQVVARKNAPKRKKKRAVPKSRIRQKRK